MDLSGHGPGNRLLFNTSLASGSVYFSFSLRVDKLGANFTGILTTDRWAGYNWFDIGLRQLCWSHLTRDFARTLAPAVYDSLVGNGVLG